MGAKYLPAFKSAANDGKSLLIQATDPEAARNLPIPTLMNFEINSPFAQTNEGSTQPKPNPPNLKRKISDREEVHEERSVRAKDMRVYEYVAEAISEDEISVASISASSVRSKVRPNSNQKAKKSKNDSMIVNGRQVKIGTFSKRKSNLPGDFPILKTFVSSAWDSDVCERHPNFTWRNAAYGLNEFLNSCIRSSASPANHLIDAKQAIRKGFLKADATIATLTGVSIANAFATASPPLLECTDSQKAIYRPTAAWHELQIDALWRKQDGNDDDELTVTKAEPGQNGNIMYSVMVGNRECKFYLEMIENSPRRDALARAVKHFRDAQNQPSPLQQHPSDDEDAIVASNTNARSTPSSSGVPTDAISRFIADISSDHN